MKKEKGNILDFVTVGITLLAIAILAMAVFHSMSLMQRKLQISQVARRYILAMETRGCLTDEDCTKMQEELAALGMKELDLSGTTRQPVGYGNEIRLSIRGRISGWAATQNLWTEGFALQDYYVEEKRMSTAKN